MTISPIDNVSMMSGATPVSRNYNVTNQSAVSSVYQKAVEAPKTSEPSKFVDLVKPVSYPNADMVSKTKDTAAAQSTDAAFNQVAAGFGGGVTGYSANAAAEMYAMVGAQFDAFA